MPPMHMMHTDDDDDEVMKSWQRFFILATWDTVSVARFLEILQRSFFFGFVLFVSLHLLSFLSRSFAFSSPEQKRCH